MNSLNIFNVQKHLVLSEEFGQSVHLIDVTLALLTGIASPPPLSEPRSQAPGPDKDRLDKTVTATASERATVSLDMCNSYVNGYKWLGRVSQGLALAYL